MKIRHLLFVTMLIASAGCAGGWRDGAGPGAMALAQNATAATAPAKAADGSATHATADGALFVYKGDATSVNAAGEFNAWSTSADPLTKQSNGTWTLAKKLAAGRYLYKFVVNGTEWKQDAGAAEAADDGFGGKNSVLVVGAGSSAAGVAAAPAAKPAAAPAASAPASTDGVTFRYSGAGNTVNVASEFNNWSTSADAMTKQADGTWALTKKLAAGRYAYKFVVDGSNWKEDPAAKETVDDSYGGKNAIVVVSGASGASGASGTAAASAPSAAAPAAAKPLAAGARSRAPQVTAGGIVFTYAGAAKSSVALCGAWNNWAPNADVLTQQADGTWTITKKLPAGSYAYKFLVDGSNWKADEGNPKSADDGFGGKSSVLDVK